MIDYYGGNRDYTTDGISVNDSFRGAGPGGRAFDWYTALVVSGRELNDDPRHNYQPRVQDPLTTYEFGIDTFATIHGWKHLQGPPVQPLEKADGQIRAGGVEYLQVTLSEPGTLEIPVDADAAPMARAFRIE